MLEIKLTYDTNVRDQICSLPFIFPLKIVLTKIMVVSFH